MAPIGALWGGIGKPQFEALLLYALEVEGVELDANGPGPVARALRKGGMRKGSWAS